MGTTATKNVTKFWEHFRISMWMSHRDMSAFDMTLSPPRLPDDHVPSSEFYSQYGEWDSLEDYAAQKAANKYTAQFGCTGESVRPIADMMLFHAAASGLIAKMLKGEIPPEDQLVGIAEARTMMSGTTADFKFGIPEFEIVAPKPEEVE